MRWIITCIVLALLASTNLASAKHSWKRVNVGTMKVTMPEDTSGTIWETYMWTQKGERAAAEERLIYGKKASHGSLTMWAYSAPWSGEVELDRLVVALFPDMRGTSFDFGLVKPSGVDKMNALGLVGTGDDGSWLYTVAVYWSHGYLYALKTKHPRGERKYWHWINKFHYSFRSTKNSRLRILP